MISNATTFSKPLTPAWVDQSDEELLLAYREHQDRLAFAALVHRYERELFSYLRRYLGDAAMAEDAFQGTFLQVHLKASQFEPGRKVRPWLYTIATNQAIDAQRRNKRHRMMSLDRRGSSQDADELGSLLDLLASKETGPTSGVETEERSQWIHEAVSQLPESLRGLELDLLSRAEVSRGGRCLGAAGRHRQEPAAHRHSEADRGLGSRSNIP